MKWTDGGRYGLLYREIASEDGSRTICRVKTYRYIEPDTARTKPWAQGQSDFDLILNAPVMLEALEAILDKVECYAQPLPPGSVASARWEAVRKLAVDAIAATLERVYGF